MLKAPASRPLLKYCFGIRRGVVGCRFLSSSTGAGSTSALPPPPPKQRPTVTFSSALKKKFLSTTVGSDFPVTPFPVTQQKTVSISSHPSVIHPPYSSNGKVPDSEGYVVLAEIGGDLESRMRESCSLARRALDVACEAAEVGITTDEIDEIVHHYILENGAYPSPLNYHGFPKSLCSSVNEVICHGIPDTRPLKDGDIVSFDVSNFLHGCHGDNCATVGVGDVDAAGEKLINATKEALEAAINVCGPGQCLTEVGRVIHEIADENGFETVRQYCGHGVGEQFHMLPFVKHFRNTDYLELKPGMIFTIEPMFTEGSYKSTLWSDNWTVATIDGGRAAQFEHTILITEEGVEILTVS